jgi:hypothetical protein
MTCPFCGSVANPKWSGGMSCGTIGQTRSWICVSLANEGNQIVNASEISDLKARIATLEDYARGLEVIGDKMKQAALTCDAAKWDAMREAKP